ncbi:MAG: YdbC family protein [Anaerovoracaceae bacterium]
MASNEHEITYDIHDHIGVIKAYNSGWQKELNIIAWNNGNPKYDIREWDMKHEHMTRGITLNAEEMEQLYRLMDGMDFKIKRTEDAGAEAEEA